MTTTDHAPGLERPRVSSGPAFPERPRWGAWQKMPWSTRVPVDMGSLIKKRRKRMRKKKHKKMLKATRWQRRAAGK